MNIKGITDKKEWEDFFLEMEDKTFLQSFAWGEFWQKMGNKIWRLGIYEDSLIAVMLVSKIKAKRGTFLLIQHGRVYYFQVLLFLHQHPLRNPPLIL